MILILYEFLSKLENCTDVELDFELQALTIRQREAEILSFRNHAAFIQEILMVKNPQTVAAFLDNLVEKFLPLWEMEKLELLSLKKAEVFLLL